MVKTNFRAILLIRLRSLLGNVSCRKLSPPRSLDRGISPQKWIRNQNKEKLTNKTHASSKSGGYLKSVVHKDARVRLPPSARLLISLLSRLPSTSPKNQVNSTNVLEKRPGVMPAVLRSRWTLRIESLNQWISGSIRAMAGLTQVWFAFQTLA